MQNPMAPCRKCGQPNVFVTTTIHAPVCLDHDDSVFIDLEWIDYSDVAPSFWCDHCGATCSVMEDAAGLIREGIIDD